MLLITAALRQEISDFKKQVSLTSHLHLHPFHFYQGELRHKPLGILLTGVGPSRAEIARGVHYLAAHFPIDRALLSGFAGGLQPGLHVGQLVLATQFHSHHNFKDEIVSGDRGCIDAVVKVLDALPLPYIRGACVTVPRPLMSAEHKAECGQSTQAVMVDMESFHLAQELAQHAIPCAGVRSIFDPMEYSLSPAVCALVNTEGKFQGTQGMKLLATAPRAMMQIPQFARHAARARATLTRFLLHFI